MANSLRCISPFQANQEINSKQLVSSISSIKYLKKFEENFEEVWSISNQCSIKNFSQKFSQFLLWFPAFQWFYFGKLYILACILSVYYLLHVFYMYFICKSLMYAAIVYYLNPIYWQLICVKSQYLE